MAAKDLGRLNTESRWRVERATNMFPIRLRHVISLIRPTLDYGMPDSRFIRLPEDVPWTLATGCGFRPSHAWCFSLVDRPWAVVDQGSTN